MSSESESKGNAVAEIFRWWWLLFLLTLLGGLTALLCVAWLESDQVKISRGVYEELLRNVDSSRPVDVVSARIEASVASRAAADQNCDIAHIHLSIDARFEAKAEELRAKMDHRSYPTFEELYWLVVNRPYDAGKNIWQSFPNAYNLKPSFRFPFSNLQEVHVEEVLKMLGRPPSLFVEVGSFHGHSAILQAKILDKHGHVETPLLCIDPWTGDLGMLLFRDDWDKKLTPGELADGRSTSYWQFMLNVQSEIKERRIGPKHIIPLAVTSVVAARYLMALKITPDVIYLDSAHEADETFTELLLYYNVLAKGGIIYGDDFSWESVHHDVTRFAEMKGLKLVNNGVTWYIQKPAGLFF